MNDIINQKGEYTLMRFTGENGTWDLIGSEYHQEGDFEKKYNSWLDGSVGKTIDSFLNRKTGKYLSLSRKKVYKYAEDRNINAA